MQDHPGAMPVLVNALKKKGVRLNETSFEHGDVTYLNKNIVVLRGAAYEIVHSEFESSPSGTLLFYAD